MYSSSCRYKFFVLNYQILLYRVLEYLFVKRELIYYLGGIMMRSITNKEEALACFEENKPICFFKDLSEELQNDPEVIFAYAKKWSWTAYEYKREFFRSSRENMKRLMTTKISLDLLEDEDLEDIEYMRIAIMSHPDRLIQLFKSSHKDVIKRGIDKEMALHLVHEAGSYLSCLLAFQNDDDVVYEAISNDVRAIQYASPRIQCFFEDMIFVDKLKFKELTSIIKEKMEQLKQLQTEIGVLMPRNDSLSYLLQMQIIVTEEIEEKLNDVYTIEDTVKQKMQDGVLSYRGEILYKKRRKNETLSKRV